MIEPEILLIYNAIFIFRIWRIVKNTHCVDKFIYFLFVWIHNTLFTFYGKKYNQSNKLNACQLIFNDRKFYEIFEKCKLIFCAKSYIAHYALRTLRGKAKSLNVLAKAGGVIKFMFLSLTSRESFWCVFILHGKTVTTNGSLYASRQ